MRTFVPVTFAVAMVLGCRSGGAPVTEQTTAPPAESCDPAVPLERSCPDGWGLCQHCSSEGKWELRLPNGWAPYCTWTEREDGQVVHVQQFTYDDKGHITSEMLHYADVVEVTRFARPHPGLEIVSSGTIPHDSSTLPAPVNPDARELAETSRIERTFDAAGRVVRQRSESVMDGLYEAWWRYDADGRAIELADSYHAKVEQSYALVETADGEVLEVRSTFTAHPDLRSAVHVFDRAGRLLRDASVDSDGHETVTEFVYDAAGVRFRKEANGVLTPSPIDGRLPAEADVSCLTDLAKRAPRAARARDFSCDGRFACDRLH